MCRMVDIFFFFFHFQKIDGKLTIDGDMSITGKLNGWDLTSDLLMLDYTVPHTGKLHLFCIYFINNQS